MNEFKSRSQAGQDRFVWEMLGPGAGTFLDIGANHPSEKSNTFALERMGWRGVLVENDVHCVGLLKALRTGAVVDADATLVDWREAVGGLLDLSRTGDCADHFLTIDYLSLDVDEASLEVLANVLAAGLRFRVVTVEHDAYRFGRERVEVASKLLRSHGHQVLCEEVCDQGLSFEAWAVDPFTVGWRRVMRFARSKATEWTEMFE